GVHAMGAGWYDTCNEYGESVERIAEAWRRFVFEWLDIEDDSDVCADIDVENFPTLGIYRGDVLLHFGVSLPQEGPVARLVDEMATRAAGSVDAPEAARRLPAVLK